MCDHTSPVPDLAAVPGISTANPLAFLDPALAGLRQYHVVMAALDLGLFDVLHESKTGPECALELGCRPDIVTLLRNVARLLPSTGPGSGTGNLSACPVPVSTAEDGERGYPVL